MARFDRILSWLEDKSVIFIVGPLIFAAMCYVVLNVLTRYVFNYPLLGMNEVVGLLMVPITYFALSYGWRKKGTFISADFVLVKMKGNLRLGMELFIQLFTLIFFAGLLGYSSYYSVIRAYQTNAAAGSYGYFILTWPFKATIAFGFLAMVIRIILEINKLVRRREAEGKPVLE